MKINIEGKNIELTQGLKDHITDKLHRLQNHYSQIIKEHEVKVKLSVLKNPRIEKSNITEVTIFLDGRIIRSEQASEDMYASIDMVVDKLERQFQKYKAKVYRSFKHTERPEPAPNLSHTLIPEELTNNNHVSDIKTIRTKKFKLHPMTPEEAALQLDLISHDFYVFINATTKEINTIYKRKDGNYGLIEPVIEPS